jgi:cytochrome c-type biogenesis protein CcmH/NrfF
MILHCPKCEHSTVKGAQEQNRMYGDGKRVQNETAHKLADKRVYRCTVCENERTK